MALISSPKNLHIALFPFMSKGHTIPLLHLAKLIHQHRPHATFTIFTTPANEPFISTSLASDLSPTTYTVVTLPFEGGGVIPRGVESTDQLPSMSLFHSFVHATESLQPYYEAEVERLHGRKNPISLLISDWFLYWTNHATTRFNIPRFYFTGMNVYALTICGLVFVNNLFDGVMSVDEAVQVPELDGVQVTRSDFDRVLNGPDASEQAVDLGKKLGLACSTSRGIIVNSFEELEPRFLSCLTSKLHPKPWCVGPLCLAEKPKIKLEELSADWMAWLDKRKNEGKSVLYVSFGTQAEISNEQLREIGLGLEKSGVEFIWALRIKASQEEVMEGFEERVRERGMVVRGWVEQRSILKHESVQGFLSHCGWNSIIESVCAGVPILAWPMMAEQHLNAKFVVEEVKVGLRVETFDGNVRGFVKWEGLCKMVKELMGGKRGESVRKSVGELSVGAKKALEDGGSSWSNLNALLNELEIA